MPTRGGSKLRLGQAVIYGLRHPPFPTPSAAIEVIRQSPQPAFVEVELACCRQAARETGGGGQEVTGRLLVYIVEKCHLVGAQVRPDGDASVPDLLLLEMMPEVAAGQVSPSA